MERVARTDPAAELDRLRAHHLIEGEQLPLIEHGKVCGLPAPGGERLETRGKRHEGVGWGQRGGGEGDEREAGRIAAGERILADEATVAECRQEARHAALRPAGHRAELADGERLLRGPGEAAQEPDGLSDALR